MLHKHDLRIGTQSTLTVTNKHTSDTVNRIQEANK